MNSVTNDMRDKTEGTLSGIRCPEDQCVLVFVKAPQKGRVKTRLSKELGAEIVLNIYKHAVADLIATLEISGFKFRICYHPPHAASSVVHWLGRPHTYSAQKGIHLGERMSNAFIQSFSEGFKQVLLLGSDLPDLTGKIIDEAFVGLEKYPAVIGPAFDGGYYLIGFNSNRFLPPVFDDIPWGTERVFKQTLDVFKKNRFPVYRLPIWRDIDTYEDLMYFLKNNQGHTSPAKKTLAYLSRIDIEK